MFNCCPKQPSNSLQLQNGYVQTKFANVFDFNQLDSSVLDSMSTKYAFCCLNTLVLISPRKVFGKVLRSMKSFFKKQTIDQIRIRFGCELIHEMQKVLVQLKVLITKKEC